jgi:hypothetical protein
MFFQGSRHLVGVFTLFREEAVSILGGNVTILGVATIRETVYINLSVPDNLLSYLRSLH